MPHIEQLGVAFYREDSFTMVGGRVLGDRILIGVGISEFALERLILVADDTWACPQDGVSNWRRTSRWPMPCSSE